MLLNNIAIIGAGAWGSALALALSSISQHIILLARRALLVPSDIPKQLAAEIILSDNINIVTDMNDCLTADLVIIATPINAVRDVLSCIEASSLRPDLLIVSKGMEIDTGYFIHEIIRDIFCSNYPNVGLLLGPSFAIEVARKLPTALTIVSQQNAFLCHYAPILSTIPNWRIYTSTDCIGCSAGAALKNVLAIAVGMSDGLQLGYNARAALITRSLNELAAFVRGLGGDVESIYGLTGIGDLILTCTSALSRNYTVGIELAKGTKLAVILANLGHIAEGVKGTEAIYQRANILSIDMPIVRSVYNILYCHSTIQHEIHTLLNRKPIVNV